uniref:Uncharacterized protein n=1 Tax=Anopheles merus TaxID=30066 RepID=A0A182UPJ2_ANOME
MRSGRRTMIDGHVLLDRVRYRLLDRHGYLLLHRVRDDLLDRYRNFLYVRHGDRLRDGYVHRVGARHGHQHRVGDLDAYFLRDRYVDLLHVRYRHGRFYLHVLADRHRPSLGVDDLVRGGPGGTVAGREAGGGPDRCPAVEVFVFLVELLATVFIVGVLVRGGQLVRRTVQDLVSPRRLIRQHILSEYFGRHGIAPDGDALH